MAQPLSRSDFKQYILQELGSPIINIEVTDAQLNNRIDDSLQMFRQFHYDASQRTYLKHQITMDDMNNHYIPCDDSIMSVVRIVSTFSDNLSIFDIRYQLR
jgi:hypothetical protein